MRVTNSMVVNNYMTNLNSSSAKMNKLLLQSVTGTKYLNSSEDPVSAMKARRARATLEKLSTYQENVGTATDVLKQTETVLNEINDVLQSVYEKTIQASTDVLSDEDREYIATYIEEMRDQILDALNSSFNGKYMFGGYNTNEKPFTFDSSGNLLYNGTDIAAMSAQDLEDLMGEVRSLSVGDGVEMDLGMNGLQLLLLGDGTDPSNNIFSLLTDLSDALNNGADAEYISDNFLPALEDAQAHYRGLTTEVGAKLNRLEMLESRYEIDYENYREVLSNAEEMDEEELLIQYMMAYNMYSAALALGSYVIQPTLMDFLG